MPGAFFGCGRNRGTFRGSLIVYGAGVVQAVWVPAGRAGARRGLRRGGGVTGSVRVLIWRAARIMVIVGEPELRQCHAAGAGSVFVSVIVL